MNDSKPVHQIGSDRAPTDDLLDELARRDRDQRDRLRDLLKDRRPDYDELQRRALIQGIPAAQSTAALEAALGEEAS